MHVPCSSCHSLVRLVLVAACAGVVPLACGGSSSSTGASTGADGGNAGAGNGDAGSSTESDAGSSFSGADGSIAACSTLAPPDMGTPPIHVQADPSQTPPPQGGTIVDGTYRLTSVTVYSTSSANAPDEAADALRFSGSTMEQTATNPDTGESAIWKFSYFIAPSGTELTESCVCTQQGDDCSSATGFTTSFTATADEIDVYDTKYFAADPSNPHTISVYKKEP